MILKTIPLLMILSLKLLAATDNQTCDRDSVANLLRDLNTLEVYALKGTPPKSNFKAIEAEFSKMQASGNPQYAQVQSETEKKAKERVEKILTDFDSRQKALKKQIADAGVSPATYSSLQSFTSTFNAATSKVHVSGPSEKEESNELVKVAIGYYAHNLFTQKTTEATKSLIKLIEDKCIPQGLPRGMTIGNVKYNALYCVLPTKEQLDQFDKANGPLPANQCRTAHACGIRTLPENSNQDFKETVIGFGCTKKANKCPEMSECLMEAAKNEMPRTNNIETKTEGARP